MVESIFLQDGEKIFVDDEDYERVNQHTWTKWYEGNSKYIVNRDGKNLATFICEGSFQKNKGNDFTKNNLTTKGTSAAWQKAKITNKSKYKGVSYLKNKNKWRASIYFKGRNIYLGTFEKEDDAAKAYNKGVLDYWNGNGYLNQIGKDNRTPTKTYKTYKNQNVRRRGCSGYKGVCISGKDHFRAYIYNGGKFYHLGIYNNKQKAALVYNKCAIYLYGNEVILNNVPITDNINEFISNWKIPDKIKALKEGAGNE